MAASGSGLAAAMDDLEINSDGSDSESEIHDDDVVDAPDSSIEEPEAHDSDESSDNESDISEHTDSVDQSGNDDSIKDSDTSDDESIVTGATSNVTNNATSSAVPKPRSRLRKRSRPEKWLNEVKHYQSTTKLLIRKAPFKRLVREIAQDYKTDLRFSVESFEVLQEASEDFLVEMFDKSQRMAIHRGAQTIEPKDMQIVIYNTRMQWGQLAHH